MQQTHGYEDAYNSLPDVIVASRGLEAQGKQAVLDRLCSVILQFGLQEEFGIRLLHSHHPIHQGEVMVEEEEAFADCLDEIALTTKAVQVARCGKAAAANSWKLHSGEWLPVEYSVDSEVVQCGGPERHPAFATAFAAVLAETGVADLLGLCAARRGFFGRDAEAAALGYSLLETTDVERRANILRYADVSGYAPENLIQTVWLADDGTSSSCLKLCGIKCAIFVVCGEDNSGGHRSEIGHTTSHQESH